MVQVSTQVPELCVLFHESVQALSKRFLAKERRYVYITPTSYLELILLQDPSEQEAERGWSAYTWM